MVVPSRSARVLAAVSLSCAAVLVASCKGEDRPLVEVIGGGNASGSASGSVSASGPLPTTPPGATAYAPVSNVDSYLNAALDIRDIRMVMAPATEGRRVDWAAAQAIYENGKNQTQASGSLRPLASIPDEAVQQMFPNGAAVYGRANFIDALIRDGLTGTGRAQGLSDDARRQIVDKGLLMLVYGKALQEMDAARTRVDQKNTDNATGAPHAVDEAWAIVAGATDQGGAHAYSLLATAAAREGDFKIAGKLRAPLEAAFVAAQAAAQKAEATAFAGAHAEVKGYLTAIFYLSTLHYAKVAETDTNEAQRQLHLAEGGTYFQAIRALVASASPSAAQTVESAFTRPASQPFPASLTTQIYSALNEPAVLQALGFSSLLVFRAPPGP